MFQDLRYRIGINKVFGEIVITGCTMMVMLGNDPLSMIVVMVMRVKQPTWYNQSAEYCYQYPCKPSYVLPFFHFRAKICN